MPHYYDVDVSDIWHFEREYFFRVDKHVELAHKLIIEIQSILIKHTEPIYGIKFYNEGDENAKRKYERERRMYGLNLPYPEKVFDLNYFFIREDLYQYETSHTIIKDQVDDSQFHFFFAFKLRQYRYDLMHIKKFLNYQLKSNFKNNRSIFEYFLRLLLRQYPDLFTEEVKLTTNEYIKTLAEKHLPETLGVLSFVLYEYERLREEYFITNANGFAQAFSDLKKHNFIHQKTNKEHFKKIFTLSVINPDERIRWTGRDIELKWFVQILIDDLKKVKPPVARRWETTLHCFVNKNGLEFEKEDTIGKASGKIDNRKERLKEILSNL